MQKSNFTVIEDEQEIKQAQLTFAKNMQKEATKDGEIIAGHQGSTGDKLHAYWFKDNKFWWAYKIQPNEKVPRWWNSFSARETLRQRNGEPRWNKTNGITCEINPPLSGNTWRTAGVFVKDQNDEIYIAHTGKIGGGKTGVGKTAFVNNFPDKNKWHQVSGSRGKKNVVIVSNINDPKLIDNVEFFVKAVAELKPEKNSNDEFEFVKKDFDSIGSTKQKEASYRGDRLRKFGKVLEPNLISSFDGSGSYVGRSQTPHESIKGIKGKKKYLPYSWLGIWFGEEKYDTLQFQVALSRHGLTQKPVLSAGIFLDGKASKTRPKIFELIRKQRDECFTILKNIPSEYDVLVWNENKGLREGWKISELKAKDMDVIVNALSVMRTELKIARHFTEKEALDMKTSIVYEISDTFEKLLPLHQFLTEQNNGGGNGSNSGDSIDKKFKDWLKRSARKDGKSIEEYAKDLGKEEIEGRHKKFSELKKVLDAEPIDLTKISPVLEKAIDEHPTWIVLDPLEGSEISDAITALKEYKNETNIHLFLSNMNQARPPGREDVKESERRTGLDRAQNLLIASVCLTALHPSKFVDFRKNRWEKLAKLIQIEDKFTPVKTREDEKTLEEVGKFAKMITETPTFKKYWGNQPQPLWTLAGICWHVKDDKPEGGDTNMDELVEKILQMEEYKLAIDKNVVKRIIRHLRGRKNVVLVGAPGVGKTVLARKILKIVGKEDNGTEESVERVAHAEWTKLHVTGGLNLKGEFVPGCVTFAAQEKKWLLIDEFNRADINKAFGEMFLGIESNTIEITPEEANGRSGVEKDNVIIDIPEKFRMVCTMNDYDKNLLLTELSFGLITRFAFVDIKPNEEEELDSIKAQLFKNGKINSDDYEKCKGVVEKFYDFIKDVRAAKHDRMIGVRTCVDVFRYTVSASKEERKINPEVFLDEALCDYVLPQFDRLDRHVIESAIAAAKANLPSELLVKGDKKPSVFFESLERTLIRLKALTSWFDDKSDDDDNLDVGEASKSNVNAEKKNYSPRAYKAHDTMKRYVKTNNIEWARKNPKNHYAKQIFKNNPKKSKKK